jgi:Na+/H+ antiporter NhaD/arsenite permease-like protein
MGAADLSGLHGAPFLVSPVERMSQDARMARNEGRMHQVGMTMPLWTLSFFALDLLAVALLPMIHDRFWSRNRNKAMLSAALGLPVAALLIRSGNLSPLLHEVNEYVSFMLLLTSLFIISGGIYVHADSVGTPTSNTVWLAIGALLANVFGTMGAAVILIRPFLRMNVNRQHASHLPVFFIFLVCNIGGCLTPLGDPPLFMGHLRGVPFFWTFTLLPEWLLMTGAVLCVFWFVDRYYWLKECAQLPAGKTNAESSQLTIKGWSNAAFILGVVLSVAYLNSPAREIVLVVMTVLSLLFTAKGIRSLNQFHYGPIIEVAIIFAGIFVTMVPALLILKARGGHIGIREPWQYFWATGIVSSFLDNTPSYLSFLSLAQSMPAQGPATVIGVDAPILRAISCGAVFMGALTYIGNGPNFIVKAICEHHKVRTPTFLGYMMWSVVVLFPLFIVLSLLFYR